MAFINFYLDKPFDPGIEKQRLKPIVEACDKDNKPYPKNILNPRPSSLYLFFSYEKGMRIKIRTNVKVRAEQWNFKIGFYKSQVSGSLEFNNELNELSTNLLKNYSRLKEGKVRIREEEVRKLAEGVVNGNLVISSNTFIKSTEEFFIKKKDILSEGTFKEYRTVFKSIKEFEEKFNRVLKFEDFDQGFFNDYEQFMVTRKHPHDKTRGLYNDTIVKYVATLKSFLYWCHQSGYFNDATHLANIKSTIKKLTKNDIVVLTEPELFQLYQHDFSQNLKLDRARDLFCFGCFTGQRFSDIMRFNKYDFNNQIWSFKAYKTKKDVVVPFEGFIANALPILEKYNYMLPVLSNQKMNDYLKEIGELAGMDAHEKIIRFSGVKEFTIRNPKYKFMSCHMGRRTFVTLMLEKNVAPTLIQEITKHSDLRTLLKYNMHSKKALVSGVKNT